MKKKSLAQKTLFLLRGNEGMKKILISLCLILSVFLLCGFESKADNAEKIIIVIDPGHGGDNLGAKVDEIVEKDINLKVAKAMRDHLSMYEGVEVHLTHDTDKGLTLKKRAQIAEKKNADYLISLHFNAAEYHQNYGTECWVPYDDFYEETYEFAAYFIDELTKIGLFNRGIKTRLNDEGDNYYGIIRESEKLDIPCVLVEHCHLDNAKDAGYFETDKKLEELGVLDAEAVAKYLRLKSKRLGTDYSDYSLEVAIPPSENTRDKTGPSKCALAVKEYKQHTGEITLILTTREDESRLLYYDYSIDGGITYTERLPLEKENIEFSLILEEGTVPEIVARAYNLNEIYTESNIIVMDKIEYVPLEEDVPAVQISADEKRENEFKQKILSFLVIVLIVLIICFLAIITLYMIKYVKHAKRRKQRRNMHRKRQE